MFLARSTREEKSGTFLCLRRGVSWISPTTGCRVDFSLPTQRCFSGAPTRPAHSTLFSAYAEVFRPSAGLSRALEAFLCLRRGVSSASRFRASRTPFSLPTQRCFGEKGDCRDAVHLFSAYAEVFLQKANEFGDRLTFLCLRRGVSIRPRTDKDKVLFSLPTQRCF